jgi:hypothetical protein
MKRATLITLLAAVNLAALVAAPRTASAAPDPRKAEAGSRFERGLRLFDGRDYSGAIAELTRAYELVPNATVLYDIGAVYAAMGRPADAVHALDRALAKPGELSAEDTTKARAMRAEQATHIGQVHVTSSVPGGHVEVDGLDVGVTPLTNPVDVTAGTHVVGVYATGYVPQRREVTVSAQTKVDASFDLVILQGKLGHVKVRSKLPGARLFANNDPIATTPIPSSVTLAPGKYQLELRRDGYKTARVEVSLGEGAEAEVDLDPTEDPSDSAPRGSIVIDASEPGSALTVDGVVRGVVAEAISLPAGPHHLRLEKAGFVPSERDADVVAKDSRTVSIYLAPTPETRAALEASVTGRHRWAWGLIGAGLPVAVAGFALGGYESSVLSKDQNTLNAFSATITSPTGACNQKSGSATMLPMQCTDTANADTSAVNGDQLARGLAFAAGGVGVAAAVTGLVLLLTSDDAHKYDRAPASASEGPSLRLAFVRNGMFVGGTF